MGRQASVRQKNGHWFSEAGGVGRYLGRCDVVTRAEAMAKLWTALAGGSKGGEVVTTTRPNEQSPQAAISRPVEVRSSARSQMANPAGLSPNLTNQFPVTVSELRDRYLAWVKHYRSPRLHDESQRHLQRFCEAYGGLHAVTIAGSDLEAFQQSLQDHGHAPLYVRKHATTIRTMFNRGVKAGWLPSGLSPFDSAESIKLPHRPLLESDLPTDIEVHALLSLSDPFMADIIRLYYATGARTHELIEARVIDFQPKTHAIVLGRHKRSQTMKDPVPRTITLNDTAFAILQRRCEGRSPDDHVIINRKGNPYDSRDIAQLFAVARKRGGVRSSITIYSFRHLWISEMLMAGVDVLLVARMAGTSVAMVERVYGHFRNQSYQDAQARLDKDRGLRGV